MRKRCHTPFSVAHALIRSWKFRHFAAIETVLAFETRGEQVQPPGVEFAVECGD